MRVTRLYFQNVMGLEELEIKPGAVTVIEGGNGAGKSSVIEGLKALRVGGHDPTLLRQGADEGHVGVEVDGGKLVFDERITLAASTLSAKDADSGRIGSPKSYLDKLLDGVSANPVAFLTGDNRMRVEILLNTAPLSVTPAQLRDAVGDIWPVPDEVHGHALTVIDKLHKLIYDERTGVNRVAKDARTTAGQLKQSLPPEVVDAVKLGEDIDRLTVEYEGLREEFARRRDASDVARKEKVGRLERERDREIERLQEEILRVRAETATAVADLEQEAQAEVERAREQIQPRGLELRESIAALTEKLTTCARDENTRRTVVGQEAKAAEQETRSEQLSGALTRLEALKTALVAKSPVKGMEIREGQVYLGGVPFERANNAERVKAALHLATLRVKDVGLICVDGLECLEAKTFAAFEKAAAKYAAEHGVQYVLTRVTEGPLTVRTVEAEEASAA